MCNNTWLMDKRSFTVTVHVLLPKYTISVQVIDRVTSFMRWQWWMHDICTVFISEWCVLWSNRCGQSTKQTNKQTVTTQALKATKEICLGTGYIWVLISTYHCKSSKLKWLKWVNVLKTCISTCESYVGEHARNSFYILRQRINLLSYAFFWVISPASEFYMPTFRNTLSVPSS